MNPAEMLRMARRRTGLSQRAFCLQAGLGLRTLQEVESGRTSVSCDWLSRAMAIAGLELVPSITLPEPDPVVRSFLCLSLPMRLYRAVGGRELRPQLDRSDEVWGQLRRLARGHDVALSGRAALCLWLPPVEPLTSLDVDVVPRRVQDDRPVETPALRRREPRGSGACVPVPLGAPYLEIFVPTPGELAFHDECVDERLQLLAVASLLDDEAPVDRAGRRVMAHRDPAHFEEQDRIFHTKRFHPYPMPPAQDVRSWRLHDDASAADWLRRHGIPG